MKDTERQLCLQSVTKKLVTLTALCLVALAITLYVALPGVLGVKRTYLVVYVFGAGLIGGFVSIQQRLPAIQLAEIRELSRSWLSILLIPVNGGVFALVLMLMFIAGLLEGALFPKYTAVPIDHGDLLNSFANWLAYTFPEQGRDLAKLFFWSFVAGFSERFVPQIIRRTAERSDRPSTDFSGAEDGT
jgi:hypothetical protein